MSRKAIVWRQSSRILPDRAALNLPALCQVVDINSRSGPKGLASHDELPGLKLAQCAARQDRSTLRSE